MPITLQQNPLEGSAWRAHRAVSGDIALTLRRLASGLRIERAADDVAGVGISERLNAQVLGAHQSLQNIAHGVSLAQVLDGALAETEAALQRVRELSAQAASELLSREDRDALGVELNALVRHVDAIAAQTTFNGKRVLSGEFQSVTLHIGGEESGAYELRLANASAEALGRQARYTSLRRGVFVGDLAQGDLTLNGVAIRATGDYDDALSYSYASGSALAKAKAINDATRFTGVRALVEETVVESFEPVRAVDLTPQAFFKVNGYAVTATRVEDKDATGQLVAQLNAGHAQTGVVASIKADGTLRLVAEDGRNITVEYGTAAVRDAIRLIDSYGDPINLVHTVDPPQLTLDGDIEGVSFVMNGGGSYDGAHAVEGAALLSNALVADATGGYDRPRDNVDYVLEVVHPGPVGVATFRYKEESVPDYAVDAAAESYLFNAEGVVTSSTSKVAVQGATHYNEGSDRRYVLHVTKGGLPSAASAADLPEFYYEVLNIDTGVIEYTSPTLVADQGTLEALPHNVLIDYPTAANVAYNAHAGTTVLTASNMSGVDAAGDQYTANGGNPRFVSWTGDRTTEFTIEVVSAGHVSPTAPLAGSHTGYAQVRVTAHKVNTGATTSQVVTVSPEANISLEGFTFRFDGQSGSAAASRQVTGGSYASAVSAAGSVFVGPQSYRYVVRPLSDGVITATSTLQGQVFVYDAGGALLDSAQTVTLRSGAAIALGAGVYSEGARLTLGASAATSSLARTSGDYAGVGRSGSYAGTTDEMGVFRVTQAGRVGRSAQFEYFYLSDPNTRITGTAQTNNTLFDGMSLSVPDAVPSAGAVAYTPATAGAPAPGVTVNASGYTAEQAATSVVMDVVDDGAGGQQLATSWTFADGATSLVTSALAVGASVDVGFGVRVQLANPVATGDRLATSVALNPLEVGDEWRLTLKAGTVTTSDSFTVSTTAADLALGTAWYARGEVPEWLVGETYTLTANHNFVHGLSVLSSPVNLPGVGAVRLTGAGSFKTGDEIRIRTRGYTGGVESSGFYTDNLYPTDYIVTITSPGPIGVAQYSWTRADGRQDLSQVPPIVGSGTGVTSLTPTLLEAGVNISFTQNATGNAALAVGDLIRIPVGQKLEYTFAGRLTLQSEGLIEVAYADLNVDNQAGRFLFVGDAVGVNAAGTLNTLGAGPLGVNGAVSLNDVSLSSRRAAEVALDVVDLALSQVGALRARAGAALSALDAQAQLALGYAARLSGARQRLREADVAEESARLARLSLLSAARAPLAIAGRLSASRALELLRLTIA